MFRELALRLWALLTAPGREWEKIAASPEDPCRLFVRWVLPLASIPLISALIGFTLIAPAFITLVPEFAIRLHNGLAYGLMLALVSMLGVYVAALAHSMTVQALGGKGRYGLSLELYARSWTPVWLGGILYLVPSLGGFSLVASLVSLWLLFRGVQAVLGVKGRKALEQTALAAGIIFVLYLLLYLVVSAVLREVFSGGVFLQ